MSFDPVPHLKSTAAWLQVGEEDLPLPAPFDGSVDFVKKTAVIFHPHPDDECLMGILPYRLQQEQGWTVINVPVSLGSDATAHERRQRELDAACRHLNFQTFYPAFKGGNTIPTNVIQQRDSHPDWNLAKESISAILQKYQPDLILTPHAMDHHPTHIGTHYLVMDTLKKYRGQPHYPAYLVETEFWHPMAKPNLLVTLSTSHAARLIQALAMHEGEVSRNPYHLRLPAWLCDNVRRGTELIGGFGATAPKAAFGVLLRYDKLA
jgi:N-acetylglucosamine malate deacetylase 1